MNAKTEVIRQAAAMSTADDGLAAEGGPDDQTTRAPRAADDHADAAPQRVSVDPMRSTDRYRLSLPGSDVAPNGRSN
ncbi:MAG: hypothetical protein ACE37K_12960 [Planctomycetota bacterium]